jgi:hypothetical protein
VKKGQVASLTFIVQDTEPDKGYLVNRVGLQTGAERVAKAKRIYSVIIPKEVTPEQCIMRYLEKAFLKVSDSIGPHDVVKVNLVGPDGEIKQSVDTSRAE